MSIFPAIPPASVICPRCYRQSDYNKCSIVSRVHPGVVLKDASKVLTHELLTSAEYVRELASRECPICGYLLPYNAESVRTLNVAIIGDVGSGKSHYIAALLRHIQAGEVQSEKQYVTFTCLTPDVLDHYKRAYITPLFERKEVLPSTRPLIERSLPLIYEINIMQSFKTVNLVLHDVSGEDYVNTERLVQYCPFVLHADAIIYLVDPYNLPGYNLNLPPRWRSMPTKVNPAIFLASILSLIERFYKRKAGTLSPTPCAIVLSKSDLWLNKIAATSPDYWLNSSLKEYRKGVNLENLNLRDHYLQRYIGSPYYHLIDIGMHMFRQTCFFATSATGHAPDEIGHYPAIEPQFCLDPLLWILDKLNVVKIE